MSSLEGTRIGCSFSHNRKYGLTFLFIEVTMSDTGPKEASSIPKSNPPEALGFTCQATSSQGIMALAPARSPTENISLRNWGRGTGYVSCKQIRLDSTMSDCDISHHVCIHDVYYALTVAASRCLHTAPDRVTVEICACI